MRVIKLADVTKSECPVLYEHEFRALLEALRRDLRREQFAIDEDVAERQAEHQANVRYDKRALDVLQPKHSREIIEQPPVEKPEEAPKFQVSIEFLFEAKDDTFQSFE